MSITVKNYLEQRAKIDFSKLPDKYKKVDEFITEALDFYGEDAEIDKTIDEGIKQLNGLHVANEPDKIKTLVEKKPEQKEDRIKLGTSATKPGIIKLISEYYGGSTITLNKISEKSNEYEVSNKNGLIDSAIVVNQNDRFNFYQVKKQKFKIGESVNIIWGEDEGKSGVIEKVNFDEHLRDFIYTIEGASKRIGQSNLEPGNGYKVVGKKNGQLVDISEQPFITRDKARNWINEQGINNHYENVDIIPSRGKAPAKEQKEKAEPEVKKVIAEEKQEKQAKAGTEAVHETKEEAAKRKEESKKEIEAELQKIVSGGDMSMSEIVSIGRRINGTRSFRSQFIDNGSDNKRRLTPTKENLVRWLKAPGRFDLIGVDTASATDATADLKHVKKETIFHLLGFKNKGESK